MAISLYDAAVQVVPVLMIALFVDARTAATATLWLRMQHYLYLGLCVSAFTLSLLILAGVVDGNPIAEGVVIAALLGCIGLLAGQAWTRLSRRTTSPAPATGELTPEPPATESR